MTTTDEPTPVAQYLRMSTDDQLNSIPIQREVILRYAARHGFEVVATYQDPGKSGLAIRNRPGLQSLLRDVVTGKPQFKAILVYDVSRWGRFQDADEAAHYEFICRQAGVAIHYCAETFLNDGAMPNAIMKSVKRTMAAEYSRELSVKVTAALRRRAAEGFRVGSAAGFGLRRMMISADGHRKHILQPREQKYATTDRVVLVPGPKREVECVRRIFRLNIAGVTCSRIAIDLNSRSVDHWGRPWISQDVYRILKNHKYMGWNIWGKTHRPFSREWHNVPEQQWIVKKDAYSPLVTTKHFFQAQRCLKRRSPNRSVLETNLLAKLKKIWRLEGKLSYALLKKRGLDPRIVQKRFGSLLGGYQRIGYQVSEKGLRCVEGLRRARLFHSELIVQLKKLFPLHLQRTRISHASVVEIDHSISVAIHVCWQKARRPGGHWRLEWRAVENGLPVLICLADRDPPVITDYYLVPKLCSSTPNAILLTKDHPLLATGRRLQSLDQFYEAARELIQKDHAVSGRIIREDLIIDLRARIIRVAGKEIDLPPVQVAILASLVRKAGKVVSGQELQSAALATSRWKGERLLDPEGYLPYHMHRLRRALDAIGDRVITVRGRGYMYIDHPLLSNGENPFIHF